MEEMRRKNERGGDRPSGNCPSFMEKGLGNPFVALIIGAALVGSYTKVPE